MRFLRKYHRVNRASDVEEASPVSGDASASPVSGDSSASPVSGDTKTSLISRLRDRDRRRRESLKKMSFKALATAWSVWLHLHLQRLQTLISMLSVPLLVFGFTLVAFGVGMIVWTVRSQEWE